MFTDPNSPFYAAIAIGSTKVTGMVGRVDSEGAVNVLSYMAISSTDFIRKGRVYNVDKMTQCLKSIRERMENQLNCNIKQVYVALNCQGMRSTTHLEERTFPQRITVQQELIESLKADNRDKISQDQILIDSLPLEYTMGTFSTNEAVGVMTDRIRAQFLNIICNAGAIETIESSFRKAGLPIARHTMAADRLANVMTDEKERSTGCVFVDMGSETTTVAVYRGKLLRHFAVLPLGGLNITRDIAGIFNCEESEAEEFKRTYGYPEANRTDDNSEVIHLRDGGRARPLAELYDIIEARTSEIVQNIKVPRNFRTSTWPLPNTSPTGTCTSTGCRTHWPFVATKRSSTKMPSTMSCSRSSVMPIPTATPAHEHRLKKNRYSSKTIPIPRLSRP